MEINSPCFVSMPAQAPQSTLKSRHLFLFENYQLNTIIHYGLILATAKKKVKE